MKQYEDPKMDVVLFDDETFVKNGVGTSDGGHTGGNPRLIGDDD